MAEKEIKNDPKKIKLVQTPKGLVADLLPIHLGNTALIDYGVLKRLANNLVYEPLEELRADLIDRMRQVRSTEALIKLMAEEVAYYNTIYVLAHNTEKDLEKAINPPEKEEESINTDHLH